MLPVMVCLDGFTLSHVYEPLTILEQKQVDSFLPKYTPKYKLDPKKPITFGPIAYPNSFMYFKKQQQDAMQNSLKVIQQVFKEFKTKFKKPYTGNGLIETYKIEDAQYAFVTMGSLCGTIREVIDDLRTKGKKVGLIKIKCFRPFPEKDIAPLLKKLKAVAVFDKNISLGYEGALYAEIKSCLFHSKDKTLVHSFIVGLGGRDITPEHINKTFNKIANSKKEAVEWLF
jgi:pyruvate ferredoxin oxidoreductase alpha subunit